MAKKINPGILRTRIIVQRKTAETDSSGYESGAVWENVFGKEECGAEVYIKCAWTGAAGDETLSMRQLGYTDIAVLEMRYSPKITKQCRILRFGEIEPYEINSIENADDRNVWLKLYVGRRTEA